jgi:hypothetical protein
VRPESGPEFTVYRALEMQAKAWTPDRAAKIPTEQISAIIVSQATINQPPFPAQQRAFAPL